MRLSDGRSRINTSSEMQVWYLMMGATYWSSRASF